MISYSKILVIIASSLMLSCTQANEPTNSYGNPKIDDDYSECQSNDKNYDMYPTAMVEPVPITLSDKMREKPRGAIMSNSNLRDRLDKYNIGWLFDEDIDHNSSDYSITKSLYYYSKEKKNLLEFKINDNFSLRYFDYYLNYILADKKIVLDKLSVTDKQEITTLINVITDDPAKSEQILSELEQIYQQKLDKKEVLAQNIVVANVEYQGRLFELRGIYSVTDKNPKCHENRLTVFSVD